MPGAELKLDLRLTDYRATMQGQSLRAALVGGGEMAADPTGLPNGLNVTGPQGPVWLPLLLFYFPGGEDGPFDVARTPVGAGLDLAGKGTLATKGGRARVAIEATLVASGRSYGTLTLEVALDREGWPERGEGKLVSADGTTGFTLARG